MIHPIRILLLLTLCCFFGCQSDQAVPNTNFQSWQTYRGDPTGSQYSDLDQINRDNIQELEVAWSYETGGAGNRTTIECNPIIIGDRLYGTSPDLRVFALDATNGEEIWQFNPSEKKQLHGVNRGLAYWTNGSESRILYTASHYLLAIDAKTGKLVTSFGDAGRVDLRQDLGMEVDKVSLSVTTPGVVYQDLIVLGSAVGEGYDSAPGHIRAFSIETGALAWTFHTIPQAGQPGYDTWQFQEGEQYGGANAWGGLSLDEKRGWIFAATGSIAFDFYGGNRLGENLFANCIIALNARTGERIWHYQTVHHDLWDYDLPCAPNLLTIKPEGEEREVVVQPTKMGYLFVLDRETGEPVFPIDEKAMPASNIPGERAWPTQPIPSLPEPFTRIGFSPEDLSDISPETKKFVQTQLANMEAGSIYTPPSLAGTISMPGTRGGAEWSGASVDPHRGILYINANEIPNIIQLKPQEAVSGSDPILKGKSLYQANCSTCHGLARQGAPPIYPNLQGLKGKYQLAELKTMVSQGKGSMPAFPQFSETQLQDITTFLLSTEAEITASTDQSSSTTTSRYLINGYRQFLDQDGYPAIKPPWGTLTAINLHTGKRLWQQVLGEYPELTEKGLPPTGTQNLGGCITTAGGLIFVGATKDEKFRVFDTENGELLWETKLPVGGYATPSTYSVNGKQYVVIAAGGGGKNATRSGDYYVAFGLGGE